MARVLSADTAYNSYQWWKRPATNLGRRVGDRVCLGATTTDLGTDIRTSWSEVVVTWDDGEASSVSHNDMAKLNECR